MAHSKLSPSAASRWLACPGSVALCAELPDPGSSEHAREGTAAHELAAMALRDGNDAKDYIGYVLTVEEQRFTVDAEMAGYVQVYLDTVRDAMTEGAVLYVEQRVGGEGPTSGTADAIVLTPDLLRVFDLKYGRGHVVEAGGNPQLSLYGYHALEDFAWLASPERVDLCIVQPRCDHTSHAVEPDGQPLLAAGIRDWYTNVVEPTVSAIAAGAETLTPSEDACRWCPAKATCPALRQEALSAALVDFSNVPDLTEFGLAAAYEKADLVETWVTAVRTAMRSAVDAGTMPGYALEIGRQGNRKWKDAKAVEKQFKDWRMTHDEAYKSTLISPTEAEKILSAKRYAALNDQIERGPPSMKIVKVADTENKALKDFKEIVS